MGELYFRPVFDITGFKMRYTSLYVDENNHLIVVYMDGSTSDLGPIENNPVDLNFIIDDEGCYVEDEILKIFKPSSTVFLVDGSDYSVSGTKFIVTNS